MNLAVIFALLTTLTFSSYARMTTDLKSLTLNCITDDRAVEVSMEDDGQISITYSGEQILFYPAKTYDLERNFYRYGTNVRGSWFGGEGEKMVAQRVLLVNDRLSIEHQPSTFEPAQQHSFTNCRELSN
uniref:hypothetical protein n=1 Tax=Thaumasiovibrio occultus TaxID=1891184 RepID=UPI000B34DC58|nr:hypothetical protein [Thaumasiovibrio occultus]